MISFNAAAPGTLNLSLPGAVQPLPAPRFPRPVEARAEAQAAHAVMVCLSTDVSRFEALMRKGVETANELGARLYLVHVETLSESFRGGAKERLRELLERALATHEGAEAVWIREREPVAAMLDFAQRAKIDRIVIGRTRSPIFLRRSLCSSLIDRARNIAVERHMAIEIVGFGTRA
jgi:K+-sensing histidine kinase KdpD